MLSTKDLEWVRKCTRRQQAVVGELNVLVQDIDRCEKIINEVKAELDAVNARFQGPRTTREDVAYLTVLLDCAKKKLAWEKLLGSLQKRTPPVLEEMTRLLNDPKAPPEAEMREQMLQALRGVQAAMERLQSAKTG